MKPDLAAIAESFPRAVPVFPLSGVLLFPGAVLPLHIFEPRYRAMLKDARAGDGLIAMALLKTCDPEEYRTRPPYHATVCVGSLVHVEGLPDGRSNVALLGVSAGLAEPEASDAPYPVARVHLAPDRFDPDAAYAAKLARAVEAALKGAVGMADLERQLAQYLDPEQIPAGLLNTCALTAPLLPLDKLALLEERSLKGRLDLLLRLLDRPWQWN